MLNRLKNLAERWWARIRGHAVSVVITDHGFSVVEADRSESVASVRWADVRCIRAYKLDLLTVDCICLAFQVGEDKWLELTEQNEGFAAVRRKMEETFPSIPTMWFMDVAFPAFETRATVLYPKYEKLYVEEDQQEGPETRT